MGDAVIGILSKPCGAPIDREGNALPIDAMGWASPWTRTREAGRTRRRVTGPARPRRGWCGQALDQTARSVKPRGHSIGRQPERETPCQERAKGQIRRCYENALTPQNRSMGAPYAIQPEQALPLAQGAVWQGCGQYREVPRSSADRSAPR